VRKKNKVLDWSVLASIEGIVVQSILKCIRMVSEKQMLLSSIQEQLGCKVLDWNAMRSKFVEDRSELLEDVKIDLCNLASRLVTAPITGHMFLQLPVDYVSPEDTQKSLHAQLGLDVSGALDTSVQ
jgi:hypothetical protein